MENGVKSELTETLKQTCDEVTSLKAALSEKEYAMQNLICTHEKLKTTLKEEILNLEAEKRDLLSSLDEANLIREEREGAVVVCREEIQQLRTLLAESQKKCKETEEQAHSGKEAKFREELLVQFEDERNKVEDQLKWKCEQFAHLEEAYTKLQSELRELKREKEEEKLEFLGKISELESALDEKTRLAEDLRTRLEICNQVLAREESKRKLLEVELHESRDQYNSLVTDFEAAKLAVESAKRDEEIASLRGILADKSLQIKELEFEKAHNDQENQELRASLKEYREIEIGGVERSKKYRALEKSHKGCGEKIRKREVEIEKLKRDLDDKIDRLHEKEEIVEKLQNELKVKEKIGVGEVEIENLKRDLDDKIARLHEKEELVEKLQNELKAKEKIRVGEVEIENLKRDLDDKIAQLHEKEEIVEKLQNELKAKEKIRVGEVEIENLKKDLDDKIARLHEREELVEKLQELKVNEKIRVGEVEMENLKRDLDDTIARLHEKEELVEKLQNELKVNEKIRVGEVEMENLKRELDDKIARLHEKEEIVEKLQNELKAKEKIRVREVEMENLKGDEVNNLQKREEALLKEREMLICELREKNDLVKQVKECMDREKALVRENDRLICEVREREGVINELNVERAKILEKENERILCDDKEKKKVVKELEKCKERLDTLVKEKEMLLGEVRQREGIAEQLRECKEREESLVKESEMFICEIRGRGELIEELRGDVALSREHNSRLESEVCSLEEEKRKFVEIRNEMAKKLLEIKFKLDPLEEKCTEVAKEKRSEVSGLEMNLELLVEELENSFSEKEKLQLELQEMATGYFLQKHEIEFREGLFCDLEMEMENLKINLRMKEDRFEAQLKRQRIENEAKRVRFSNDIKRLVREKETLALQMHDLNCGIGSLFCAEGEIKAIAERISQKMRNEGEAMHEKKCKPLVPLVGTRSPLKENNF